MCAFLCDAMLSTDRSDLFLQQNSKFRELLRKIAIAEGRPPPPDSEGEEAEGEEGIRSCFAPNLYG